MATMLETPSRIWRRIEAVEDKDMPSLPSLPAFEDSAETDQHSSEVVVDGDGDANDLSIPIHSTPTLMTHQTATSTIHAPSSTSSTTRFANSIVARSSKSLRLSSSGMSTRRSHPDSFDISSIPSLPDGPDADCVADRDPEDGEDMEESMESVPDMYLPPEDHDSDGEQDVSLTEALQSVSRTSSPPYAPNEPENEPTPKKIYDYSVSLRSEAEPSPFDKFRNVAFRKPFARTRTPSLSRTTPSPSSSPTNSTPRSNRDDSQQEEDGHSYQEPDEKNDEGSPDHRFTPTPAFPPLRARFALPPPPADLLATPSQVPHEQDDEPLTPHTRRRSFLLSVINSTTRPRLKLPTPHPRHSALRTPSTAESTPGAASEISALQTAFAGVTPRPRAKGRMSHPLAQTYVASPGTSESESNSGAGAGEGLGAAWATPAHSPYDGASDRASFISTASSHDLTTHHRANTSFDPVMGFAGHGVGRFNAGKLNSYLHGLNRRLQEENELLVERLRKVGEGGVGGKNVGGSGGRRVSVGGTALGDVVEDVGGEGWVEEKAELEEMLDTFRGEVTRCIGEKEEAEKALEEERAERAKDKERWRDRMGEVERGVEGIVRELERKLQDAENKTKNAEDGGMEHLKVAERRLVEMRGERDVAVERAKKAESVLESGKELGGELKEANERVGKVMGDLRNANAQITELEEEVMRSDGMVDKLEKELKEEKELIRSLEDELQATRDELTAEQNRARNVEGMARKAKEDLQATKAYLAELEVDCQAATERIESLVDEVGSTRERIQRMEVAEEQTNERVENLEGDAQRAAELARQTEEALEAAEKKMLADEEEVAELKSKVASLERERERRRENSDLSQDPSRNHGIEGPTEADAEALENELDDANKEIARLTTLINQSPARRAMDKAKDTKIGILEKEKEELLERNKALRMTVTEIGTPNKVVNASGISPIHRQVLSMSIRAPRTPGGPLRDMSWLNNTVGDSTVSPLIAEISRLQRELDRANESIDDKLDKLEDAGLGVVGLTEKLEDARSRIAALEDEIARLSRREDRRIRRLERARCQKCHTKVNLQDLSRASEGDESSVEIANTSLPTEPPTPPTKTSEALRANLQSVNSHLATMQKEWKKEKQQLLGEKAVLEDAANRLNVQVRDAKEEAKRIVEAGRAGEKLRASSQGELEKAKNAIADLEADLKSERSCLRVLTTEQNRIQREKGEILLQLQRTESDMDDVKNQLQKVKQDNHVLETELRVNTNVEQRARLLEVRVAENIETIEQLRQERSLLATDHKEWQRRFSEISEHANQLRKEYAASQTSHNNRRHQLDLHLAEIDDLRRALTNQADELHQTEVEKNRIAADRSDIVRTVAALEADLKRVKRDAEAFGRDLKVLRAEKQRLEAEQKEESSKAERARKQSQTQIRLLNEQLEGQREKVMRVKEELKNHRCAVDDEQLSAMKLQHNKECKGLIVQIRYLKAKFTRESSFRCDLGYQKQYLLVLLARFEKSEQTIFASIARIGFPVLMPAPAKRFQKLKSVALAAVFLQRVKCGSDLWRQQSASKQAVAAALQEVRRQRIAAP